MEALREIVRSNTTHYDMILPEWAVGRDVEIIILPVASASNELENKRAEHAEDMGPLSVLGYAKTFRTIRTTDEWMQDLREGEGV